MKFLTNKHVTLAMLIAPVLAVVAYYGAGMLVGETPQATEAGQTYKLVEKPNCRYDSGRCGLRNGDFELTLTFEWMGDSRMLLKLESVYPLDGVLVAMFDSEAGEDQPVEMHGVTPDGLQWALDMPRPDPEKYRLHLVASANEALYFGDAALKFTLGQTP